MNIIECNNLTHYYGERCIYENLNFSIGEGKITGLLGKNGTGKTTTINIMNGYLQPRSGDCLIFGEPSHSLSPESKRRIGLLLEGHVQYPFFNVQQIEKYYSQFYANWKKEPYYELISKLKIAEGQKIAKMSCGQRSQVALGLIMAQDPDLLILDDFSMGLDPGYRMLFVDFLKEYATAGNKTVFVTSHIIQDMERLIDDCLILDYGRVLTHKPTPELMQNFKRYQFKNPSHIEINHTEIYNVETRNGNTVLYSFLDDAEVQHVLKTMAEIDVEVLGENLTLEEIFIGLTGKY